jgi:Cu2+-exporting ATPase
MAQKTKAVLDKVKEVRGGDPSGGTASSGNVANTLNDIDVIPNAVDAIRDLRYDVQTVTHTFPVTGMSCASCAVVLKQL